MDSVNICFNVYKKINKYFLQLFSLFKCFYTHHLYQYFCCLRKFVASAVLCVACGMQHVACGRSWPSLLHDICFILQGSRTKVQAKYLPPLLLLLLSLLLLLLLLSVVGPFVSLPLPYELAHKQHPGCQTKERIKKTQKNTHIARRTDRKIYKTALNAKFQSYNSSSNSSHIQEEPAYLYL